MEKKTHGEIDAQAATISSSKVAISAGVVGSADGAAQTQTWQRLRCRVMNSNEPESSDVTEIMRIGELVARVEKSV